MTIITMMVWLLCGLIENGWWGQLVCFATTTYLMIELSNSNALLRVRSRMVCSTFLALSCASCFLFGLLSGGIAQLCTAAATIILFHNYQDKSSPGWTFYAFLCTGFSTLIFVQTFYLVPIIWLLMATQLQSLSWRSWFASLIALFTPYWFASVYFIFQKDFTPLAHHFAQLTYLPFPYDYTSLSVSQIAAFILVVILTLMGIVHSWLRSFEDKIRIRQLYGYCTTMSFVLIFFIILQPQHYYILMRMLLVYTSPLIAHFLTLTHSKATNILFIISLALTFCLTIFNLVAPFIASWTGLSIF